ncbi:hypothetical protein pdam_00023559 [Pocillopora damicornis]|uniref:MARVEL domain-containing protein n=1 Tax=Pocillopora damicornis TaxID=46731 RepID=A0A3M6V632_POCDA|nr:uncharacterized protein LOC113669165 [Pocillopora damicornis]RMX61382.1 hypothetical protein pdam_00023559 [Pocillopora damicornis]
MASNKRDLKIISIAQLVMAGILFVLGMVDHFEVRYMYASLILMPIWIALLVIPIGIMGLVLTVNGSRPSSALMSGLRSVSIACAALSVLTTFTYAMALNSILFIKYMEAKTEYQESPWFADKGAKIEFRKEEKTMIAVHVFIIICSILEIILAIASVRTAKAMAKEPQDTQQASAAYRVVAEEDVPLLFSSSDQEAA